MNIKPVMLLLLCQCAPAAAEIYRWQDHQGRVHYSDEAPAAEARATPAELPAINVQPPVSNSGSVRAYSPASPNRSHHRSTRNRSAPAAAGPIVTSTRVGKASLAECIKAKRRAIKAARRDPMHGSDALDSWLWRNCRDFASELRRVSQEMM